MLRIAKTEEWEEQKTDEEDSDRTQGHLTEQTSFSDQQIFTNAEYLDDETKEEGNKAIQAYSSKFNHFEDEEDDDLSESDSSSSDDDAKLATKENDEEAKAYLR